MFHGINAKFDSKKTDTHTRTQHIKTIKIVVNTQFIFFNFGAFIRQIACLLLVFVSAFFCFWLQISALVISLVVEFFFLFLPRQINTKQLD